MNEENTFFFSQFGTNNKKRCKKRRRAKENFNLTFESQNSSETLVEKPNIDNENTLQTIADDDLDVIQKQKKHRRKKFHNHLNIDETVDHEFSIINVKPNKINKKTKEICNSTSVDDDASERIMEKQNVDENYLNIVNHNDLDVMNKKKKNKRLKKCHTLGMKEEYIVDSQISITSVGKQKKKKHREAKKGNISTTENGPENASEIIMRKKTVDENNLNVIENNDLEIISESKKHKRIKKCHTLHIIEENNIYDRTLLMSINRLKKKILKKSIDTYDLTASTHNFETIDLESQIVEEKSYDQNESAYDDLRSAHKRKHKKNNENILPEENSFINYSQLDSINKQKSERHKRMRENCNSVTENSDCSKRIITEIDEEHYLNMNECKDSEVGQKNNLNVIVDDNPEAFHKNKKHRRKRDHVSNLSEDDNCSDVCTSSEIITQKSYETNPVLNMLGRNIDDVEIIYEYKNKEQHHLNMDRENTFCDQTPITPANKKKKKKHKKTKKSCEFTEIGHNSEIIDLESQTKESFTFKIHSNSKATRKNKHKKNEENYDLNVYQENLSFNLEKVSVNKQRKHKKKMSDFLFAHGSELLAQKSKKKHDLNPNKHISDDSDIIYLNEERNNYLGTGKAAESFNFLDIIKKSNQCGKNNTTRDFYNNNDTNEINNGRQSKEIEELNEEIYFVNSTFENNDINENIFNSNKELISSNGNNNKNVYSNEDNRSENYIEIVIPSDDDIQTNFNEADLFKNGRMKSKRGGDLNNINEHTKCLSSMVQTNSMTKERCIQYLQISSSDDDASSSEEDEFDNLNQNSINIRSNYSSEKGIQEALDCLHLNCSEDIVDFKVPVLHQNETVYSLSGEEKKKLIEKGVPINHGHFMKKEDELLQKNFENFTKMYGVSDPCLLLGIGRYKKDPNILRFIRVKHFYVRLGRGLNDRTLASIYNRARKIFNPFRNKGKFSETEIVRIKHLLKICNNNWTYIGGILKRPPSECRMIYRRCIESVSKGKWGKEEENQLVEAIKKVSGSSDMSYDKIKTISWSKVASHVPTRNGKQCRSYWGNHLSWRPDVVIKKWDESCHIKLITILKKEWYVENPYMIDWSKVHESFKDVAPSYIFLKEKWNWLKTKVPEFKCRSYRSIINFLCEKYKIF